MFRNKAVSAKRSAGFTLIELIAVMVILGTLSVSAAPVFVDLREQAVLARFRDLMGKMESSAQAARAVWLVRGNGGATLNLSGWSNGTIDVNASGWPVGMSFATTGATATLTLAGCAEFASLIAPGLRMYTGGGGVAGYDFSVAVESDSGVQECAYYPLLNGALMPLGGYFYYFKYYPIPGGSMRPLGGGFYMYG